MKRWGWALITAFVSSRLWYQVTDVQRNGTKWAMANIVLHDGNLSK